MIRAPQLFPTGGISITAILLWVTASWLSAPSANPAGPIDGNQIDKSAATLGPTSCAECHTEEFEVWKNSTHEVASKTLTRSKKAKAMAKVLGIRRIKSDSRCASCHFTMGSNGKKTKALAGVSCESCHGAADPWLDSHQSFGSKGTLLADETNSHRDKRLDECDAAGMVRTGRVHRMAGQCLGCHVIQDEELVDLAGHPMGSDFELVAWTQGEVRHNFLGHVKTNSAASMERKRMLFIAGQMQDFNLSLQALAGAKGGGVFEEETRLRVQAARGKLIQISELIDIPEVDTVLKGTESWTLAAGCTEQSAEIQKRVSHCAVVLEARANGSEFGALDPLLPSAGAFRGTSSK